MNDKIIQSIQINSKSKRVLFVPDSIWGELSGHRSSKYLVEVFLKSNNEIAVYAPKENHTKNNRISWVKILDIMNKQNITTGKTFSIYCCKRVYWCY